MKSALSPSFYLCRRKGRLHSISYEIHAGSTAKLCILSDKFADFNKGATELCGSIESEYADDLDIISAFCL